ncbi:hypothetical protein PM082_002323 [Marasmius tenuissimus]|nr:hypothetical protein PM082_002323 [Marasmius tenuissimus]
MLGFRMDHTHESIPVKFITLGLIPIPVSFLYTHAHMPKAPRTRTQPARRAKKPASKKQQTSKKQKTAKQPTKKRKPTKQQQLTSLNERIRDILGNIRLVSNILEPLPPPQLRNQRQTSSIYIGATAGVTRPDHPRFGDLGLKYYLQDGQTVYPLLQPEIPKQVLTGNARLMALLRRRNVLNGWVYREVSGCYDEDSDVPHDENDNNDNNVLNMMEIM